MCAAVLKVSKSLAFLHVGGFSTAIFHFGFQFLHGPIRESVATFRGLQADAMMFAPVPPAAAELPAVRLRSEVNNSQK